MIKLPINNPLPYNVEMQMGTITNEGQVVVQASQEDLTNVVLHHHDQNLRFIARLFLEIAVLREQMATIQVIREKIQDADKKPAEEN